MRVSITTTTILLVVSVSITQTIVHLFARQPASHCNLDAVKLIFLHWPNFFDVILQSYCQCFLSMDHSLDWNTNVLISLNIFTKCVLWHTRWQVCIKEMNICKVIQILCQCWSWICLTICQFVPFTVWRNLKLEIISVTCASSAANIASHPDSNVTWAAGFVLINLK